MHCVSSRRASAARSCCTTSWACRWPRSRPRPAGPSARSSSGSAAAGGRSPSRSGATWRRRAVMPYRLGGRLARFAEGVRTPPNRPVEVVRGRGVHRRHRQAAIAVLAAVVVIVVVGTVVGASMARGTRALPPVSTPVPTAFPAGFRMPHDGEPGWARSDDPSVPDGFTSCDGTDVTVDHRVPAVTATGPRVDAPAGRLIEQVLLYDSVLAAQTALASLYHAALVCHWSAGIGQDPFYAQPRLHAINQLTDVMAVGD